MSRSALPDINRATALEAECACMTLMAAAVDCLATAAELRDDDDTLGTLREAFADLTEYLNLDRPLAEVADLEYVAAVARSALEAAITKEAE